MGENEVIIKPDNFSRNILSLTNVNYCNCTVKCLKFLIGSKFGELTVLNQFIFQSILIKEQNFNLYNSLRNIILETILHLEFLGDAVIKFGGRLKFSNGQEVPWTVRYLNYETNQNSFLSNDIRLLEQVILNYRKVINCVNNESLKNDLIKIIEDKNKQILVLKSYLN